MKLITDEQLVQLLSSARAFLEAQYVGTELDPKPVVKLFTRNGVSRLLLSETDPAGSYLAYGICDSGNGRPVLGYVHLCDLEKPQAFICFS